jgi:tetratricopeptide (TPR) repeat protein
MLAAPDVTRVRVWQDTIQIPTYAEGPANPNPPFDLLSFGRFNYPYPLRDALTEKREVVNWRALHLENEYLRLTVLPDLGGHVYSCLDKRNGRQMFYANSTIKKALIGYRGAWAAFGIEFNFPVSHNWMSLSPVDFATAENADGSGSVWVGNHDEVYGGTWRVELRLSPGRALLEQRTELSNPSDARLRYYWWNNAAVEVWPDSHLVYPTEMMATHGFTRVEPWPVDRSGRDLSVIRNQTDGPVSLFTFGTREPFVGVYHPRTNSGTVHVADPSELPTHKVWSWGYDRDAADWRTALSDDDSAYIELQSGLFRNQETYAFLEPQDIARFSEVWIPVRDLGGISRASADGVINVDRPSPNRVRIALDVTRDIPDARIVVRRGAQRIVETRGALTPRDVWRTELDALAGVPVTFEVSDGDGRGVLTHTEKTFDVVHADSALVGPRPSVRPDPTEDDADTVVEAGMIDELEGRRLAALSRYQAGLTKHPSSLALLKAAGRLAAALGWRYTDAGRKQTLAWLESARSRNTTDFETEYYYGLALTASGRRREAVDHLEAAQRFRATRAAATVQLARLAAATDPAGALQIIERHEPDSGAASVTAPLRVSLLRRLGRTAEAREAAQRWHAIDPISSQLRYELTLLGADDPSLWIHLGADANRVLDIADEYLAAGSYRDALSLLERRYPLVDPPIRESGAVSPNDSALVAYYRAYVRTKLGTNPSEDYRAATSLSTTYVFPNRGLSFPVLETAVRTNPGDATAQFLLGSLYFAKGLTAAALDAWETARRLRRDIPTLHRNLGLALLQQPIPDLRRAREVLEEGTAADSRNVEVYTALDAVLSATSSPPRERVAAIGRYSTPETIPPALVLKLAAALAESGDAEQAERMFHGRFFPKEEGGTSVRTVYAHVRVTSAEVAGASGSCDRALTILDSVPRAQSDVPFTAGGLEDIVNAPPLAAQIAAVEDACGRHDGARARWDRLARGLESNGAPLAVAIGDYARARLGRDRTAAERDRLQQALTTATATLESMATSSPGLVEYARALLLSELGRTDESRKALQRVFLYPDRGLSHALARSAMRQAGNF